MERLKQTKYKLQTIYKLENDLAELREIKTEVQCSRQSKGHLQHCTISENFGVVDEIDKNVIYKVDENDITDINNTTVLVGNTFKNIDELQLCNDSRKVILYVTHLKPGAIKEYLSKWLYESHYSKQSMRGNLTDRIKKLNNGICYTQIMKQCFNSYDIKKNTTSTTILGAKAINIIKELYDICPSMCGSFVDYLIRRIISEITNRPFSDSRATKMMKGNNIITYHSENDNIWEYIKNDDWGSWQIRREPLLSSNVIGVIDECDRFIGYEKKDEWLKVKYKNIEGWVRWKLPKIPNGEAHCLVECYSDPLMNIENKYIKKVTGDNIHMCSKGCKYDVEQFKYFGKSPEYINSCSLKSCQHVSYEKVKDTENYQTKYILNDIFAISLSHTESFGFCPKQEKFDVFHDKLNNIVIHDLVEPLTEMCKNLIYDKKNILLNPALGGPLNEIENASIPSDADLVIDDTIYDIKCTRTSNIGKEYYELLQLLGYSGLLLLNKKFEHKINNMIILNILEGTSTKYNISYLEKGSFVKYIQQLTKV